jgi:PRTRC genetic system protein C
MLVATALERKFSFKDKEHEIKLADPSAVLNFYAQTYPILVTAKIEGPEIRDDAVQYRFVSTIGTKG